VIVTEYGAAELAGKTAAERVSALVAIAHWRCATRSRA
jgi:acyl-CoA hydrolase